MHVRAVVLIIKPIVFLKSSSWLLKLPIFLELLVVKLEKVLDHKFNNLVAGDSWKFPFELY